MYELKKIVKVVTSKFVGTGPSSYKKNLPGRGLTKVEKHCPNIFLSFLVRALLPTHFRCRGYLMRLITLNDTHTHTVSRTSKCKHTTFTSERHTCHRRDSNS